MSSLDLLILICVMVQERVINIPLGHDSSYTLSSVPGTCELL